MTILDERLGHWLPMERQEASWFMTPDFRIVEGERPPHVRSRRRTDHTFKRWVHPDDWPKIVSALKTPVRARVEARLGYPGNWRAWVLYAEPHPEGWYLNGIDLSSEVVAFRERGALMSTALAAGWTRWAYYPYTEVHLHPANTVALLDGPGSTASELRELSHTVFLKRVYPDDRSGFDQALALSFARREPFTYAFRVVHRDGAIRWIQSLGTHTEDLNDRPHLTGWMVDVTAERCHAETATRMKHVEAMATLASGIAHDFKNQLTILGVFFSLVEAGDPGWDQTLPAAQEALEDAHALAVTLMDLARETPRRSGSVALRLIVEGLCAWATKQQSELIIDIGEAILVQGDPVQVRQVVENLVRNAVEATFPGGRVAVEARQDGDTVELTVTDNGPGVPVELRQRILEPYFTTKSLGQGLGLASVYAIVRAHGGQILVEDGPTGGACFRVRWPAAVDDTRV